MTDKILCGCAYFKGRTSGNLELFDIYDRAVISIIIPEQIQKIHTFAVLNPVPPLDYLEIKLAL